MIDFNTTSYIISAWNSLPSDTVSTFTISSFKTALKHSNLVVVLLLSLFAALATSCNPCITLHLRKRAHALAIDHRKVLVMQYIQNWDLA